MPPKRRQTLEYNMTSNNHNEIAAYESQAREFLAVGNLHNLLKILYNLTILECDEYPYNSNKSWSTT